jgi:signal transduction histidine kinase
LLVPEGRDITDSRRTEEALRNAQKMESLGRLAGGVAHDFNNLLTATRGNAELLAMTLDVGDASGVCAAEIQRACDSAAGLTRQLLAFSRRQVVEPEDSSLARCLAAGGLDARLWDRR